LEGLPFSALNVERLIDPSHAASDDPADQNVWRLVANELSLVRIGATDAS